MGIHHCVCGGILCVIMTNITKTVRTGILSKIRNRKTSLNEAVGYVYAILVALLCLNISYWRADERMR